MTKFRDAQIAAAQDFHAHEMAIDGGYDERRWMRWLRDVERLTGIANLDGNRTEERIHAGTADAASMDECSDWFDGGWTAERAAGVILHRGMICGNLEAQRGWKA